MNKKKIGLVTLFFILCLSGGVGAGYVVKAKSVTEEISTIYYSILSNLETKYLDATQLATYNELLTAKEQAFKDNDLDKLLEIQQKMLDFQKIITEKKQEITQQLTERKTTVEGLGLNEGATEEETASFNTLKTEILQMITDEKEIADIDVKIAELQQLIATIHNNIDVRATEAENAASSGSDYTYTPPAVDTTPSTPEETTPEGETEEETPAGEEVLPVL